MVLVLSLAGAAWSYLSYSTNPDTPPDYYNTANIHHGVSAPVSKYYEDGTHRTYVYEGIHPTGSQLIDDNGNMLEENYYKLSDKDNSNILVVAQTKYYTFWGQFHQIVALILFIIALAALVFLVLALIKKSGVVKA